jgi:hypothetical protein
MIENSRKLKKIYMEISMWDVIFDTIRSLFEILHNESFCENWTDHKNKIKMMKMTFRLFFC